MNLKLLLVTGLFVAGLLSCCTRENITPGAPQAKEMGAADLEAMLKTPPAGFVLIDVRTPEEYASGHIPGALNIPVNTIGTYTATAKAAPIVVYCRSGNRSAAAKKQLDAMGFTAVTDFGAVSKWQGPLVKGDSVR